MLAWKAAKLAGAVRSQSKKRRKSDVDHARQAYIEPKLMTGFDSSEQIPRGGVPSALSFNTSPDMATSLLEVLKQGRRW